MFLFSFIRCQTNLHEPLRRDVESDGRSYVGHCRHCEAPIYRQKHRHWRKRVQGWELQRKGIISPIVQQR